MYLSQDEIIKYNRNIVERFMAKYYADEVRYFTLFWDRFTRQVSESGKIDFVRQGENKNNQIQFLAFAKEQKLRLVTPFTIMIVSTVLQEMNVETSMPSVNQIGNAIRKCAVELGAPRRLISQMEQYFAQSLYETFKKFTVSDVNGEENATQSQQQVISISPSEPVTINGGKIKIQPRQAFLVFCELVRKRRLHWAYGFILFERWCRFPKPNPKRRFQTIIDKLNIALRGGSAIIEVRAEKEGKFNTGFSQLIVPNGVQLEGDVEDARLLYEEARELVQNKQFDKSISILQESFQKDEDAIGMMLLFVELVLTNRINLFEKNVLHKVWNKLHQREVRIYDAISSLSKQGDKNDWRGDWEQVYELKLQFEEELAKISEGRIIIDTFVENKGFISEDDIELGRISKIFDNVKNKKTYDSLEKDLQKIKSIPEIMKRAEKRLFDVFNNIEHSEYQSIMQRVLIENICRKGKHPREYLNLKHLKNDWVSKLSRESAQEILEDTYSITKDQQKLLKQYRIQIKKILEHNPQSTYDELSKKLQKIWDPHKFDAAEDALKRMQSLGNQVDSEMFWSLFYKHKFERNKENMS